jgi:DNA-binding beta-propeller fold protein YncE
VLLKTVSLVLLLFLMSCDGRHEPRLFVSEVRCWSMPADGAKIPAPRSLAVGRNGEVVVVDTSGRVLLFDPDGSLKRHWRMPDVDVGKPEGVCVLKDGRIVVSDTHYHRIIVFDGIGKEVGRFGSYGTGPGQFIYPVGVVSDPEDNLYVCEYGSNDRVQKFSSSGRFLLAFGSFGTEPGQFQRPSGMAWHDGKIYVADAVNNRIQVFSDDGKFLGGLQSPESPLGLDFPYDLKLDDDGALYVVEYGAGRVTKVALDGRLLGRFGSPGTGEGQFRTPWGIAVDSKMRLLIADTGNRRIVELKL